MIVMESKIYHIYNKENQCLDAVLTEEEFRDKWENLDDENYEYEELEINKNMVSDSSY
jgi:hypothetical protein